MSPGSLYRRTTTRPRAGLPLALLFLVQAAALPADPATASKSDHWAFKPAARPAVPSVKNPAWARNSIDHFVLAKLEAQGLPPSAEADRLTLVRRLSFDLTGLPPTPDDVAQFLSDTRPDAYDRLVDRLLASPRYGERWARHWLDVVHYGESHGYDKDKPRLNAWPYRDYVIRAFNDDKPYSRFVQEQLAGDVLFPDSADGIVATGFIAAGPWDFVGHVELPESKTDGLIARYNDRDDMVMNTFSTFLSLTVHCARCHDHKFDPISQEEYYGLQAVFAGVDRADRPFDINPEIAARRRTLTARRKGLQSRRKELDAIVAKTSSPEVEQIIARLQDVKDQFKALPKPDKESPSNGYHSAIEPRPDTEKWVQVDLGQATAIDEVRLIPARPTDFPDTPGFGFPLRFRVELAASADLTDRDLLVDHTAADFPNPGNQPLLLPAQGRRARFIRVTATRLWERTRDYVFALAELQVFRGTNNVALHSGVTALDSIEAGRWGKTHLVDNFDSRKALSDLLDPPELLARRGELASETERLERQRDAAVQALLPETTRSERTRIGEEIAVLTKQIDALPKPQWVFAAANDFSPAGSFVPSTVPRPVHLLRRGDVKRPGPVMAPGALHCVPGLAGALEIPDAADEGGRRAALARWITDGRNLLTRRSIVNRVWQYHFGRGLVDTPNDFGHMGSPPTHPELLDWLAFWFLDHNESLKQLHRLIVTSATYRQSSAVAALNGSRVEALTSSTVEGLKRPLVKAERTAAQPSHPSTPQTSTEDSDNHLLWRMNRQRLDAESFRDSLLMLSGTLDLTMGGPSVQQFYFKDDHSPTYDYARFEVDSPAAFRRSVYRFIVRSVADPFMEAFDCPDANLLTPKRSVTLTALQALSTLNDAFVLRQCELFAARLEREQADPAGQIRRAWWLALGRAPRPEEANRLAEYARKHGLVNACRILVNTSEFVFID